MADPGLVHLGLGVPGRGAAALEDRDFRGRARSFRGVPAQAEDGVALVALVPFHLAQLEAEAEIAAPLLGAHEHPVAPGRQLDGHSFAGQEVAPPAPEIVDPPPVDPHRQTLVRPDPQLGRLVAGGVELGVGVDHAVRGVGEVAVEVDPVGVEVDGAGPAAGAGPGRDRRTDAGVGARGDRALEEPGAVAHAVAGVLVRGILLEAAHEVFEVGAHPEAVEVGHAQAAALPQLQELHVGGIQAHQAGGHGVDGEQVGAGQDRVDAHGDAAL